MTQVTYEQLCVLSTAIQNAAVSHCATHAHTGCTYCRENREAKKLVDQLKHLAAKDEMK